MQSGQIDTQVRGALHEIIPAFVYDVGYFTGIYSREALVSVGTIPLLLNRLDAGEFALPTYCHGIAAAARHYLIQQHILPKDEVRGRTVLTEDCRYHTALEYRDGDVWRLLDPAKHDKDFWPSDTILFSWEAMRNSNKYRLQKRRDKPPEVTAMKVLAQDLVTAVDGPFQPWNCGYKMRVGNMQLSDETGLELYRMHGHDLEILLELGQQDNLIEAKESLRIDLG